MYGDSVGILVVALTVMFLGRVSQGGIVFASVPWHVYVSYSWVSQIFDASSTVWRLTSIHVPKAIRWSPSS